MWGLMWLSRPAASSRTLGRRLGLEVCINLPRLWVGGGVISCPARAGPYSCFSLPADRGNDNWLIKYDCPLDSAGVRVSGSSWAGVRGAACSLELADGKGISQLAWDSKRAGA